MKNYCHQNKLWARTVSPWILLSMLVILTSCSDGLRLKNLVNYPVIISSLNALDTLKIPPDVVKYSGSEETSFRQFAQDIRLQGHHADRPIWQADQQGCFRVASGANIHILDFNFQGSGHDSTLIRIDSGRVILENCHSDLERRALIPPAMMFVISPIPSTTSADML